MQSLFRVVSGCVLFSCLSIVAQMQGMPAGKQVGTDVALDRALKTSSLTVDGKPFHAVVEIGKTSEEYSGRVEVWWQSSKIYKLQISSPKFSQTKIVNGDKVWEKDDGNYYPRWLENFVLAILDPVPGAQGLREVGPQVSADCLKHEDRPGGITDELSFEMACWTEPAHLMNYVLTFGYYMQFKDFADFGTKKIARTYETRVLDFRPLAGRMTTLDGLDHSTEDMFRIDEDTPAEQKIATDFVSTLTEERMVDKVPVIEWPPVREGKTDGYMIVYARTDRTGQVRETARHNSDNVALEGFGMQQALKYKFKPLVVNGVPMQMEMPLVLHFTSRIENPIPELDDVTSRKLIKGCPMPREIPDPASAGKQIVIQFQISEDGALMTLGSSDRKIPVVTLYQQFRGCHFGLYQQNGTPTAYHANVTMTAR